MSTPTPDIVSQLREWIPQESICTCAELITAAAAEIERLRKQLAAAEEAIRFFAKPDEPS